MTKEGEVKLIGIWESPFVARVRIALNLKGIEYEFLNDDLMNKSELLIRSNPVYKKVPVFFHGDKTICESLFIVQYIDEVWADVGEPILPEDPYDRATARFWARYVDDKLTPQITELVWGPDESNKADAKEQAFAALLNLEQAFMKSGNGRSFFGGDSIGFVDVALGSLLRWLKAVEIITGINLLDKTKTPLLVEWAECFCSAEAAKEVLPEAEKLVEYSIKILPAIRRAAADASPSK